MGVQQCFVITQVFCTADCIVVLDKLDPAFVHQDSAKTAGKAVECGAQSLTHWIIRQSYSASSNEGAGPYTYTQNTNQDWQSAISLTQA